MNENYTRVANFLIKDADLKPKELLVATTMLTTLNSKNICIFNLQSIYNTLHIKDNNTRAKEEIKSILKVFQDIEVFEYYNNIFLTKDININKLDKNTIIYALLIDSIEGFTKILDDEIYKIIEYSKLNKIDSALLLNTLLYILSFISENEKDENYKLAFPSLVNIAENIGITEKSVLKYINILKDLDILVFDYAGIKELRKGEIKNTNMFYARKEDEERLLNKLKEERSKKGFIIQNKINKDKSNLKRKLKQEINYLNKKDNLSIIEEEKLITLKENYNKLTTVDTAIN